LDRIGAGGMAEVFRAVMPGAEGFKRTFVVKRILGELSRSTSFIDMFVREARIGALLNHPNIVQVYDFGNVEGEYFLAMEYVKGRDVLAVMRRLRDGKRSFPVAIAAFIAHEVAGCLAYAHALLGPDGKPLDIIHRDVSPSNIMCLRTGGVKLLDFGIARAAGDNLAEPEDSGAGTFKGKLGYLPPERVRNEPFDHRSDLYALGVVLWEMLTCKRLFRGANEAETLKNVLDMPIAPPSSVNPEVPASLDAIVMRALERDPARRYASGQEMAEDLEEVLRETKFNTRMVGKLLVELFGSGQQSSQIALSALTPELLALAGAGDASGTRTPLPADAAPEVAGKSDEPPRWKSRRLWVGLGAAVGLVLVATLAGRSGNVRSASAKATPVEATSPPVNTVASPAPSVAPEEPAPALEVAASNPHPRGASPHAPRPAAPARRLPIARKHAAGKPAVDASRIASGLSIDPFAEAAARGHH
jgi:serine/threonine protein kinase